jgi:ABC-type polysaccharide/polyol phosphate transport system ATPase subunit
MSKAALSLQGVSKKYPLYEKPWHRLREALFRKEQGLHREFWALRGISLDIPAGTTLGILGQNGSGKSTLLQIMAGIMEPTGGTVSRNGKIATILELGAGFNPDFTGRENIFLNGYILGVPRSEMKTRLGSILKFAEIGEFIDQPVHTYSNGMYVRLAFAVAINLDPDILLVDEILAVGDTYFQHKCVRKIRELQEKGRTIVYVTHDIEGVRNICDQALILDYSKIIGRGPAGEVANQYMALIEEREKLRTDPPGAENPRTGGNKPQLEENPSEAGFISPGDFSRYGRREAEITRIEILNGRGIPATRFQAGEELNIRFHVRFNADVRDFIIGNIFRNKWGLNVYGMNTEWQGLENRDFRKGDRITVIFHHRANFAAGSYTINPATSSATGKNLYRALDWINNAAIIEVSNPRRMEGYVSLPCEIELEKL